MPSSSPDYTPAHMIELRDLPIPTLLAGTALTALSMAVAGAIAYVVNRLITRPH